MKRFSPDEPVWAILSTLHRARLTGKAARSLPKCPYCGGSCGMTVRQCAEARGSRKDLKHKIRDLEKPLGELERNLADLKNLQKSFAAQGGSSNTDIQRRQSVATDIQRVEGHLQRVHAAVDPLYEAYLEVRSHPTNPVSSKLTLQWPNPRASLPTPREP